MGQGEVQGAKKQRPIPDGHVPQQGVFLPEN